MNLTTGDGNVCGPVDCVAGRLDLGVVLARGSLCGWERVPSAPTVAADAPSRNGRRVEAFAAGLLVDAFCWFCRARFAERAGRYPKCVQKTTSCRKALCGAHEA